MRVNYSFIATCLSVLLLVPGFGSWAQDGSPTGSMGEMIAREKVRIARVHATIDKKLSVPLQKSAYYRIVAAERKAYEEAKAKYPNETDSNDLFDRAAFERRTKAQYRSAALVASNLTEEEGDVLETYGSAYHWPSPHRRDPSHPRVTPMAVNHKQKHY